MIRRNIQISEEMEATCQILSDEVHLSRLQIVKNELIIDSIRRVVNGGYLLLRDEEFLLLALNPTEIGIREMDLLNLPGDSIGKLRPRKMNIPKLKHLVEKELNETIAIVDELDRTVDLIKDPGLSALVNEIQDAELSLKRTVRKLYKTLKILCVMDVKELNAPIQKSLNTISIQSHDLLKESRCAVDSLLADIFNDASEEDLTDIVHDLELALEHVKKERDSKKNELEKFDRNKDELLPLVTQLKDLDKGIAIQSAAYASLTQDFSFNSTL